MKTRWTVFFLLLSVILLLPGCGGSNTINDKTLDFITVALDMHDGKKFGDVSLGMTADQEYAVAGTAFGNWSGIWPKYNADGAMVSMMVNNNFSITKYGTSTDSHYADLIPAYSQDPDITVELDTKEKVIFAKEINGVKYTVTYRCLANSGVVKNFSITNTAEYTENDADYN